MESTAKKGRPWFSYIGGIITGIGWGILFGAYLAGRDLLGKEYHTLVFIGCLMLVSVGSFLHRHGLEATARNREKKVGDIR